MTILTKFKQWRQLRNVMRQFANMDNRTLGDLGIARRDIYWAARQQLHR